MTNETDMMAQMQNYQQQSQAINNMGFQLASALQIRLDTSPILQDFSVYLKGEKVIIKEDENGNVINQIIKTGEPIINDKGYQSVMETLTLIVNSQTVQGNFLDEEMYADYLIRTRKDLAMELMDNRARYGIDRKDYDHLLSKMMRIIEAFMTRPIMDKERGSYAQSLRVQESLQTSSQKGGMFNLPFIGGKK